MNQDLVEDSEDDRGFDEISETAPPIELPAAELARLEVQLFYFNSAFLYFSLIFQCSGDF